jgi:tetratricopeptide (TPR) repeat protein
MPRHSPDLFKNRSTTQDFLFSHADKCMDMDDGHARTIPASRGAAATPPCPARFIDMLDRPGLIRRIDTHMADAPTLCAIAVGIESNPGANPVEDEATGNCEEVIQPIATLCQKHHGAWAQIARDRFACVFARLGTADGQDLAHDLLTAYPQAERERVTIGVAAYPILNTPRSQIVDNAEKALEHAGIIGPATITAFDAVSLNISGDRCYQAGDIAGAIAEFKQGLRLDPSDMNLHNSLGVCYGILGDYAKALAAFENAIWLAPQEMMAVYNQGYVLLRKGQRDQALECFLTADAREPNVFEVIFHLGQTYMAMGAPEKARPYLEAATRANRRSGPAFTGLGMCLDKLGLTKEAIQAYKRAIKINPADAESLSILGRLYSQRGESLDVASALCEQSVRLSPGTGAYRHRLGHVYLNQGKLDHALAAFELAVALGHDSHLQIETTQERMLQAKAS